MIQKVKYESVSHAFEYRWGFPNFYLSNVILKINFGQIL